MPATNEIRVLTQILREINKAADFNQAVGATLRSICYLLDWQLGEAWIPNAATKVLDYLLTWHDGSVALRQFEELSNPTSFAPGEGLPGRAWKRQVHEWIPDITAVSLEVFRRVAIAKAANLHAALAVPIRQDGEVLAVLVLFKSEVRQKDDVLVEMVVSVADELGFLYRRIQMEESLRRAKAQTDQILQNTSDGLFLLGPNLEISSEHSRNLRLILECDQLDGAKFPEVLRGRIDARLLAEAEGYCQSRFHPSHEFDLTPNPLAEFALDFADDLEPPRRKYLRCRFSPIVEDELVQAVLVTLADVTEPTRLNQALVRQEQVATAEMRTLMNVLRVNPVMLEVFIAELDRELNVGLDDLADQDSTIPMADRLRRFLGRISTAKGNAALLDVGFIVEQAHRLEAAIQALIPNEDPGGNAFVPLIFAIDELRQRLELLQDIIDRIVDFNKNLSASRGAEAPDVLVLSLQALTDRLAKKYAIATNLQMAGFQASTLPPELRGTVKDILVQLIRNSFAFGLETAEWRRGMGKAEFATITIGSSITKDSWILHYADDGRGLDPEQIQVRVEALHLAKPTGRDIAAILFEPGFSTFDDTGEEMGQGVGLALVKELVNAHDGQIRVGYQTGQFLKFQITFPLRST